MSDGSRRSRRISGRWSSESRPVRSRALAGLAAPWMCHLEPQNRVTGEPRWHREVLKPPSFSVLERASESRLLKDFYLAGGTGLALRLGHRKSDDLDFFGSRPFSAQDLLEMLSRRFGGVELGQLDARRCKFESAAQGLAFSGTGIRCSFLPRGSGRWRSPTRATSRA